MLITTTQLVPFNTQDSGKKTLTNDENTLTHEMKCKKFIKKNVDKKEIKIGKIIN